MSNLYSTQVKNNRWTFGNIRSEDGILELKLALPKELGSKVMQRILNNYLQAGYAACFGNAIDPCNS
jgi:organic hydroperoxide reductase OsmC/OhrA